MLLVLDEGDPARRSTVVAIVARSASAPARSALDAALVERWLEHRNDVAALEVAVRRGLVVDTTEIAGRWRDLPAIYDAVVAAVVGRARAASP